MNQPQYTYENSFYFFISLEEDIIELAMMIWLKSDNQHIRGSDKFEVLILGNRRYTLKVKFIKLVGY